MASPPYVICKARDYLCNLSQDVMLAAQELRDALKHDTTIPFSRHLTEDRYAVTLLVIEDTAGSEFVYYGVNGRVYRSLSKDVDTAIEIHMYIKLLTQLATEMAAEMEACKNPMIPGEALLTVQPPPHARSLNPYDSLTTPYDGRELERSHL